MDEVNVWTWQLDQTLINEFLRIFVFSASDWPFWGRNQISGDAGQDDDLMAVTVAY